MIQLKSPRELETMAAGGRILAATHQHVKPAIQPGVSTWDLDMMVESFIRSHAGAAPSFKGLYGFPKTLCTSVDTEIVHGIPSKKVVLREGSIVSVDVGVHLDRALVRVGVHLGELALGLVGAHELVGAAHLGHDRIHGALRERGVLAPQLHGHARAHDGFLALEPFGTGERRHEGEHRKQHGVETGSHGDSRWHGTV